MEEPGIKVTDRRMFTADGELREEFRAEIGESAAVEPEPAARPEPLPAAATSTPEPAPEPAARVEIPDLPPGLGPTFFDLVGVLADPIPLYLGDAALPDGRTVENLEMARLHIDLLELLRQKTRGNLAAQELAVLEDLLYRARMRYVQKRG